MLTILLPSPRSRPVGSDSAPGESLIGGPWWLREDRGVVNFASASVARPESPGAVKPSGLHWAVAALSGGLLLLAVAALPTIGALHLVFGLRLLWILAAALLMIFGIAQVIHYSLRLRGYYDMSATTLAIRNGRAFLSPSDVHFDLALKQFLLASRHQRRLSCIAIEVGEASLQHRLKEGGSGTEVPATEIDSMGLAAVAVAEATRGSDLTIKGSGPRQLVVLCPETGWNGAARVARKIDWVLHRELGLESQMGVATFPEDATSLRELMERAESDLRNPRDLGESGQLPLVFPGWDGADTSDTVKDSPMRAQSA